VIATGTDNGMVEFVPSHTLAAVLEKHKAIAKFLAMQNPDPQGPFGMHKEVRHPTPAPRPLLLTFWAVRKRPSALFPASPNQEAWLCVRIPTHWRLSLGL